MNNRDRIAKAIKLVRPVMASTRERRPRGMKPYDADLLAGKLDRIVFELEQALELYPGPAIREIKEDQ